MPKDAKTTTPTPNSQVEVITPLVAEEYLASNTFNRPLKARAVAEMAEDMLHGRWVFNGDAIRFSSEGRLLDGQHRLSAIIESGTPIPFFVVRGLSDQAFTTIDAGKARTAAQVLALQGGTYNNVVSSAARMALLFSGGSPLNNHLSRKTITDFARGQPYLCELVGQCHDVRRTIRLSPFVAVVFLANYRRQFNTDLASFVDGVGSGANLERGDPRLTLRDWAAHERVKGRGALGTGAAFVAIARAWNAHVRGETLLQLKVHTTSPNARNTDIVGFHFGVGMSAGAVETLADSK